MVGMLGRAAAGGGGVPPWPSAGAKRPVRASSPSTRALGVEGRRSSAAPWASTVEPRSPSDMCAPLPRPPAARASVLMAPARAPVRAGIRARAAAGCWKGPRAAHLRHVGRHSRGREQLLAAPGWPVARSTCASSSSTRALSASMYLMTSSRKVAVLARSVCGTRLRRSSSLRPRGQAFGGRERDLSAAGTAVPHDTAVPDPLAAPRTGAPSQEGTLHHVCEAVLLGPDAHRSLMRCRRRCSACWCRFA